MQSAGVESIDALKALRVALWKFVEAANGSLSETDSDIDRTLMWLEIEQQSFWDGQIRKRNELVARAKDALRSKKIYRSDITRPSTVEEEKALAIAQRRLEEANEKLGSVRRLARKLQKDALLYRGQVQRLALFLQADMPQAVNMLDQMIAHLEEYVAIAPSSPDAGTRETFAPGMPAGQTGSMARATPAQQEESQPGEAEPRAPGAEVPNPPDAG